MIDGLKDQFVLYHATKLKQRDLAASSFKLNDVLNINVAVKGLKIPIPFRVDPNFHRDCHGHFDVLLVSQAFRDKLGQLYQTQLLRKINQQPRMQAAKEEKEVEFKASRFRSISMQEFDLMKEHLKVNASPLQREQYQSIESRATIPQLDLDRLKQMQNNEATGRESLVSLDADERREPGRQSVKESGEALSSMEVELQEVFVASVRAANPQRQAEPQKQGQGDSQNEESTFNQEWNMNWNQNDDKPADFDFLAYPEPAANPGENQLRPP